MKFYPTSNSSATNSFELEHLKSERLRDNFNPSEYVTSKVDLLKAYFNTYGLQAAVVAISGGIDSAVVAGILDRLRYETGITVYGVTLPALDNVGVTNQETTIIKANEVFDKFYLEGKNIDMAELHHVLDGNITVSFNMKTNAWAKGQSIPYLRTALLYSITAMLTENNQRAVLVGTTNRDEGLYLGYIGKASDGMVDIQPISDLHKSEVRQVAEYLGVPQSILDAVPTGDMCDNRSDEDVFGASYDMVEFALRLMNMFGEGSAIAAYKVYCWDAEPDKNIMQQMKNIDDLHKYNKHKYLGCSPAVHFDIKHMKLVNGWKYSNWNQQ